MKRLVRAKKQRILSIAEDIPGRDSWLSIFAGPSNILTNIRLTV